MVVFFVTNSAGPGVAGGVAAVEAGVAKAIVAGGVISNASFATGSVSGTLRAASAVSDIAYALRFGSGFVNVGPSVAAGTGFGRGAGACLGVVSGVFSAAAGGDCLATIGVFLVPAAGVVFASFAVAAFGGSGYAMGGVATGSGVSSSIAVGACFAGVRAFLGTVAGVSFGGAAGVDSEEVVCVVSDFAAGFDATLIDAAGVFSAVGISLSAAASEGLGGGIAAVSIGSFCVTRSGVAAVFACVVGGTGSGVDFGGSACVVGGIVADSGVSSTAAAGATCAGVGGSSVLAAGVSCGDAADAGISSSAAASMGLGDGAGAGSGGSVCAEPVVAADAVFDAAGVNQIKLFPMSQSNMN
ncbi:hypothetical protein ACOSP7_021475 [Xanthoceras sorbifolium]